MHLDGLADTADGVGAALGGRDPSVGMKDPRLGTFGGAALVLDLLLKTSVLAVLVVGGRFPGEAIAAAALGRGAALALAVTIPYAGAEDGAGAWLAGFDRRLCFAVLAIGSALAIIVMRLSFVPMLLVSLVVTVLVRWWSSRRLGGATGDVFGATSELTETLALVAAALAVR
jgi:adenosylcobinamide-GDP ribazoletransferase